MPAKPRRPPAPASDAASPVGFRRPPTRKLSRGTWIGTPQSACSRLLASSTTATIAVVSSAFPPGFSDLTASTACGGSCPSGSAASGLTLRMAASTRAAAASCNRWTIGTGWSGEPSGSLRGVLESSLATEQIAGMSGEQALSSDRSKAPQCLSTMEAISSSVRLSKMPSLPRTTRSPWKQFTVFIRAPWMTRWDSAAVVFGSRMTCTGLLAS
mmetsp:Transcript_56319/g.167520  ORF Transcript_56319/g.167520 Transcript_56319/m.167520 type:complete len:213 (+) Transcript_56319:309-947(+)